MTTIFNLFERCILIMELTTNLVLPEPLMRTFDILKVKFEECFLFQLMPEVILPVTKEGV